MATAPQSAPPDTTAALAVKGNPVDVVLNYQQAGNGPAQGIPVDIDCRNWNAVALIITVTGSGPSAIVSLLGSEDDKGLYLPLPDPAAAQTITADIIMEAPVSTGWARVRFQSLTGAFAVGQGFTITAIPYIAPGITNITATLSGDVGVNNFPATQAVDGTVTANQGTAAAPAGAWPAKVTDGTNTASITAAPGVGAGIGAGVQVDPLAGMTIAQAAIDTAASGNTTIVAGVAGKVIYVLHWHVVSAGTVNARWEDSTPNNLSGAEPLIANSGVSAGNGQGVVLMTKAAGAGLVLNLSAAVQVSGVVVYGVK